jgi:hypothetical protein
MNADIYSMIYSFFSFLLLIKQHRIYYIIYLYQTTILTIQITVLLINLYINSHHHVRKDALLRKQARGHSVQRGS